MYPSIEKTIVRYVPECRRFAKKFFSEARWPIGVTRQNFAIAIQRQQEQDSDWRTAH
jgi:hypothetical protein